MQSTQCPPKIELMKSQSGPLLEGFGQPNVSSGPLPTVMECLYAFAGDGRRGQRREGGGAYMETKLTRHDFVGC